MTNPVAWKALYRRYVSLIYRSQLFPPQVRAHAIYFTRHAFRYGVPIDSSTTNSCPVRYSTEEALTRGQRTLDLVLQLAVDRKERMNHDDTCSKDSGLEEENSPNPLGLESVYRDVEDSSTSILEQLEGDELIRALFKRLVVNVVVFTILRHDRKNPIQKKRHLYHPLSCSSSSRKNPFISMDKCISILNRELGTLLYTRLVY